MRLLAALLLSAVVSVQAQDAPTFRTSTRLVQVDVVVKAKDASVEGLTKDDFQLLDNGKPQQIAVFSVRDSKTVHPQVAPLPPGVVTNRPQFRGPEPVSATVILLDSQNTPFQDQGYARLQALKYLDRVSRNELVAVYRLDSSLSVLQEFTENRSALRTAIDKFLMTQSLNLQDGPDGLLAGLTGNAANAMRAANTQRQADITSAAFELIARHLTGLPGRKKLIWITAAPPLTLTQQNERNGVTLNEFTNLSKQLYDPMKLMNNANVAIYPVDPRGVMVSGLGLADPGITTMIRLAEMTGGKPFYNDNDISIGIEEAFSDTDLTYTLGFYPINEGLDGSLHSISVKINRRGADARYRKSYTAETVVTPPTEKVRKATLSAWLGQPLESTEIPIQAKATPAPGKPGYYDVEVLVDPSVLRLEQKDGLFFGLLELALVPDTNNKQKGLHQTLKVNFTQASLLKAMDTGVLAKNQIRVTDGKGKLLSKKLHVVVMDPATGKTGSVRIPLN